MRAWADVAVLAKAKGQDGRFIVHSTAGLPFLLEEGDEVAFVPPRTDLPRRATVAFVRQTGPESGEVCFEGIDGAQTPRDMLGMHCLIERASIAEELFESQPRMWGGWNVVDKVHGKLGEVVEVIDNPGQMLLRVKRENEEGDVLIPVVDEIVVSVDVDGATITTAVPAGLVELGG